MWRAAWGLAAMLSSSVGCIHARDFGDPRSRITENSAYTEVRPVRLDFGLIGRDISQLGATVGVRGAVVPGHFELGSNLAHLALGIANVQARFCFVEQRHFALGGRAGFRYLNSHALWLLPPGLRRDFGKIHLASAPVELVGSFPVAHWLTINTGLGYRHSEVWGRYRGSGLAVEGAVAARQLYLDPYFNFYAGRRVAIIVGAHLPLFAQGITNVVGYVDVRDGVRLGAQSVEWMRLSFTTVVTAELAVEARLGEHTNMRLSLVQSPLAPLPLPALNLYWRLGEPRRTRAASPPAPDPTARGGT